ncbi:MAG: putative capsid assembly scaffolding protein [Prokaryotic dsDNA virus sp.]|nr:MAG: putative capsid assembly scaffolding protein [Prokaryotic dsDNA virus sp.]|tara:strand:- start:1210 stop:1941 length:732 start_codon:yes stop_codon:yes gene_type:complete
MAERIQMDMGTTGPEAPSEEMSDSQETVSERPEWLPEKFESPEALAHAYGELESKLGTQPSNESAPESTEAITEATGMSAESLEGYTKEFTETGELSAESYEKITNDYGIPEDIARAYVEGQKALISQAHNAIYNEVGGEESYGEMIEWAKENLSEEEVTAYDRTMDSGDINSAMMAARGLAARYAQVNGSNPSLLKGAAPSTKGGNPFRSWHQVSEAMRDPRYQKDSAFRQEVQDRLSISQL